MFTFDIALPTVLPNKFLAPTANSPNLLPTVLATPVDNPSDYLGVENVPNLDLYNPALNDFIGDIDGDGYPDYNLTDSIRIENCVFQRISVINNIP